METSKPLPYEQTPPPSEADGGVDSLPSPLEGSTANAQEVVGQPEEEPRIVLKEAEFARQAVRKRPEAVRAHVEAAAEKGEAQEAVYELRHEIKDEPAQPMVPVGSVVAEIPERQPAIAKAEQYVPKSPSTVSSAKLGDLPRIQNDGWRHTFAVYQKPILLGFAAALASISIFIIVSLITR